MSNIVNLTPHPITIVVGENVVAIAPSGVVARVSMAQKAVGMVVINGVEVPIMSTTFGEVVDLPDAEDGTLFIVSSLVASAAKRGDLVSPGALVRDGSGAVVGCSHLQVQG